MKKIIIKFLLPFSLLLGITSTVKAQGTRAYDSSALVALYNNTAGSNWTTKTNWLSGPIDNWYGVTVTAGRVSAVNLISNNLTGTLTGVNLAMDSSSALVTYNLSGNKLSGTLPFFKDTALVTLNLSNNQFTGGINYWNIGTRLQVLDLGRNKLSSSIASANSFPLLTTLKLNNNQFTGTVPYFNNGNVLLTILDLSNNQLTGAVDGKNIGNIQTLNLSNNQFSTGYGNLSANYPNLVNLNISNNLFSGVWNYYTFASLQNLDISYNAFTGGAALNQYPNLVSLNASHNQFSGSLPYFNNGNTLLTYVDVSYNQFSGDPSGKNIGNVQTLYINNNQFSTGHGNLSANYPKLVNLNISNNLFTGVWNYYTFAFLQNLDISYNAFTGGAALNQYPLLVSLNASHNQFSGTLPYFNNGNTLVTFMDLSNNQFTGDPSGKNLGNVQTLYLDSNQFNAGYGSLASSYPKVVDLNLANNLFSGTWGYYTFAFLKYLNISNNAFSGSAASLNQYPALLSLNISRNAFTGSLPFFNAGNIVPALLTSFDASYNQLSGAMDFKNLDSLKTLNLSYNKFTTGLALGGYTALASADVSHNKLTFNSGVPKAISVYAPQDTLLHVAYTTNPNKLAVVGGNGTLANATYKWFTIDGIQRASVTGDSTLIVPVNGSYYATVKNTSAPLLTLFTDTLYNALPVTLLTFNAQKNTNAVGLTWSTTNEINNSYFTVQRSINSTDFSSIGTVASQSFNGNSTSVLNYSFSDDLKNINGTVYYRLLQADKDGRFTYSNILSVNSNGEGVDLLSVYPNPVINDVVLKVNSTKERAAIVKITNASGSVLFVTTIKLVNGASSISLNNLGVLAQGVYVVQIVDKNTSASIGTVRFVK